MPPALVSVRLLRRAATPGGLAFAALTALFGTIAAAQVQAPAVHPELPRPVEFVPTRHRPTGTEAPTVYSAFETSGISSLTCEGTVDWATLLRGRTESSFREQVLPVLNGTRFLVTLDKDGRSSIAIRYLVQPISEQAARRAEGSIQTFGGVISTVIEGWVNYAMNSGVPHAAEKHPLDRSGDHYLVAFRNGPADVALTMDRSFLLEEGEGDEGSTYEDRSGSPLTTRGETLAPARILVTGWAVTFPHGEGRALSVEARYMQAGGVAVPAEMTLHSSLPSFGEITLPLSLNNYQFER